MKWALFNKVKEVMVMDGIAVEGLPDPKRIPIILSSDGREADAANFLQDNDSKEIKKEVEKVSDDGSSNVLPTTAFVGGISGGILSSCLSNGISSKAMLIYAARGIPDPEGAAILIESLGKITENESLKIDTQQLREEGASIKGRMEEIIQSYISQQQRDQSQKSVKEGIMYG
jgi:uncharacterized protein